MSHKPILRHESRTISRTVSNDGKTSQRTSITRQSMSSQDIEELKRVKVVATVTPILEKRINSKCNQESERRESNLVIKDNGNFI